MKKKVNIRYLEVTWSSSWKTNKVILDHYNKINQFNIWCNAAHDNKDIQMMKTFIYTKCLFIVSNKTKIVFVMSVELL